MEPAKYRNYYLVLQLTCCLLFSQIADFGMARDLSDTDYYISHGGKIPVKWTAPEVSSFYATTITCY